jgi:hypothetical protein
MTGVFVRSCNSFSFFAPRKNQLPRADGGGAAPTTEECSVFFCLFDLYIASSRAMESTIKVLMHDDMINGRRLDMMGICLVSLESDGVHV